MLATFTTGMFAQNTDSISRAKTPTAFEDLPLNEFFELSHPRATRTLGDANSQPIDGSRQADRGNPAAHSVPRVAKLESRRKSLPQAQRQFSGRDEIAIGSRDAAGQSHSIIDLPKSSRVDLEAYTRGSTFTAAKVADRSMTQSTPAGRAGRRPKSVNDAFESSRRMELAANNGRPTLPDTSATFKSLPPLNQDPIFHSPPQQRSQDIVTDGPVYRPWWHDHLSADKAENSVPVTVDQLVLSMLQYSPQIRAISQEPFIASTFIDVESARFDPISFLESKFQDTNDPVGNTLTTNNSPFLKDHIFSTDTGFRKKSRVGTELELMQSIGFKNSNSNFFTPQDQGTARLSLNINQPLLNGAGRLVGTSQVLLAQINTDVADNLYQTELQEKILEVIRAYWDLHYHKSVLILRERNRQSGLAILKRLRGRKDFDAQTSQIIRAESAVAARSLDLVRSRTDVQNAQTTIRELTRDPQLGRLGGLGQPELLPHENPQVANHVFNDLESVVVEAFENRPEIDEAFNKIKSAGIRHDVARNRLLPQLGLVVGTYVAALEGDSGIERALQNQFAATTPGYSAGFQFEYPLYNRAAIARKLRAEAELNKLSAELDHMLGKVSAEVEIAYREVRMAVEAIVESEKSIVAAEKDRRYIQNRWQNFAFLENPNWASPTILLEQLLDAQDRITQAEIQYSNATRNLMNAIAELRRANGSLLTYQSLSTDSVLWKSEASPGRTPDRSSADVAPLIEP